MFGSKRCGNKLLHILNSIGNTAGSNKSRLSLQVLGLSIEKYRRAFEQNDQYATDPGATTLFWEADANTELQSFVPESFVYEWDFAGLTLFSSPTAWQDFFDAFLLGFGVSEN